MWRVLEGKLSCNACSLYCKFPFRFMSINVICYSFVSLEQSNYTKYLDQHRLLRNELPPPPRNSISLPTQILPPLHLLLEIDHRSSLRAILAQLLRQPQLPLQRCLRQKEETEKRQCLLHLRPTLSLFSLQSCPHLVTHPRCHRHLLLNPLGRRRTGQHRRRIPRFNLIRTLSHRRNGDVSHISSYRQPQRKKLGKLEEAVRPSLVLTARLYSSLVTPSSNSSSPADTLPCIYSHFLTLGVPSRPSTVNPIGNYSRSFPISLLVCFSRNIAFLFISRCCNFTLPCLSLTQCAPSSFHRSRSFRNRSATFATLSASHATLPLAFAVSYLLFPRSTFFLQPARETRKG